jgi:predicted metal-dependent phosphoesterase TrpH
VIFPVFIDMENVTEAVGSVFTSIRGVGFIQLAEEGLTGIECFHGKATPEEQRLLADIASEFGMIRTAGSDCHGRTDHHAPMYDRHTSFTHLI